MVRLAWLFLFWVVASSDGDRTSSRKEKGICIVYIYIICGYCWENKNTRRDDNTQPRNHVHILLYIPLYYIYVLYIIYNTLLQPGEEERINVKIRCF